MERNIMLGGKNLPSVGYQLKIKYPQSEQLECNCPQKMAEHLANKLGFNMHEEIKPNLTLTFAEHPEINAKQIDLTDWARQQSEAMADSSFQYFTLSDMEMPDQTNEDNNLERPTPIMLEANIVGLGLTQRLLGMSSGNLRFRSSFGDRKRRSRAEEVEYTETKRMMAIVSKTFMQIFTKTLLQFVSTFSKDPKTSTGTYIYLNRFNAVQSRPLTPEDYENDGKEEPFVSLKDQLFEIDSRRSNSILEIDEEKSPSERKIQIVYGRQGANAIEPRIAEHKEDKESDIAKFYELAHPKDIQNSGIQIFNEHTELYYVENFKDWKRYGEGKIQIWQKHHGPIVSFYMLLWDSLSNELLIHMKLDANWKIEYLGNRSDTCRWMSYNYASSPKGKLERLSCRFPESKTAARFLMLVGDCVKKLCSAF